MDKKLLYKKAYRMLDTSTPLKMDCGSLCGKACCKGDTDTGMYLFPGEELIYQPIPGFLTIKPTSLQTEKGSKVLLAVCSGRCDRNFRPLGCRIFPLTPYISGDGRLQIRMDPRALHICPIARYIEHDRINRIFLRTVRNVFELLAQDNDIKDFIRLVCQGTFF